MRDGSVVMLLPGSRPGQLARRLLEDLQPLMSRPVTIGTAGPVNDLLSVQHAHQEAVRCIEAMSTLGMVGQAASLDDLGFAGLLLSDSRDVHGFVARTIGPVQDRDKSGTQLVRTLQAYFDSGASPTRAAQDLHVHVNTVARRLERIGTILGPGWQEPGPALEIQLALRLARIRSLLDVPQQDGDTGAR